ncbi:MAG: hypothetical protein HY716_11125 [Planctomycetes bacterium]|nr:hypothetical protein [Planctomycetota bacterium]
MAVAFADARRLFLVRNRPPATYVIVPELKLLIFNSELVLIHEAWERAVAAHAERPGAPSISSSPPE